MNICEQACLSAICLLTMAIEKTPTDVFAAGVTVASGKTYLNYWFMIQTMNGL